MNPQILLNTACMAYEAYGQSTDHKNYQGLPMPAFDDLPPAIRDAWCAAVAAVSGRQITQALSYVIHQSQKGRWRGESEEYLLRQLVNMVAEFKYELTDPHQDKVNSYLAQLAVLCIAWLENRTERNDGK